MRIERKRHEMTWLQMQETKTLGLPGSPIKSGTSVGNARIRNCVSTSPTPLSGRIWPRLHFPQMILTGKAEPQTERLLK